MSNEELLARIGQSSEETEFYTPMPQGYRKGHHKYVVVVGTVMSGLGKGIFSSSLAKLLQDQDLSAANFTTNGQIFSAVLKKEREGGYLGRDVQTIPHVTGEVKLKLRQLAAQSNADVVFVEVGGTVGDYENGVYLEACRELAYEEGEGAAVFVALTYVLEPGTL